MAQRTVALYKGKYIGIESIYTVINGRQINIPEKLKELRVKSQNNELFCPCGCGTNLILVAGDKNLREQHFREKNGTGEFDCTMPSEGKVSVDSKIVLKCWLDDKLAMQDIESRVPIDTVEETIRKPEFTFLSYERKIAIRYWRTRANIIDDKLDVLNGNLTGIKVIYIVDSSNGGTEGQYPEALMKLQDKQGYCLLLLVEESDYDKAYLKAVFYDKDIDGLWTENCFAEGKLKDYLIGIDNSIIKNGESLDNLLVNARSQFEQNKQQELERREEEKRLREEQYQKAKEEAEKRRIQYEREQEEARRKIQEQIDAAEKRRIEAEQKRQAEIEQQLIERDKREKELQELLKVDFATYPKQIRDANNNRWIKCEFCGKVALEKEFGSYGGPGHINLGICKECDATNPLVKQRTADLSNTLRRKYDSLQCPMCGGTLRERKGMYGAFYGCSNYPGCKYSKPIK